MRILSLAVFLVSLLPLPPASAKMLEFGPFSVDTDIPGELALVGPIDERSGLAFRKALAAVPDPVRIFLDSPGGIVQIALLIADDISKAKLETIVAKGSTCVSACALLFFAGNPRRLEGRLGVHQLTSATGNAGDLASAQVTIADVIEALNSYRVPNQVISLMLRTPADTMSFLTEEQIRFEFAAPGATFGAENLTAATALCEMTEEEAIVSDRCVSWYFACNGRSLGQGDPRFASVPYNLKMKYVAKALYKIAERRCERFDSVEADAAVRERLDAIGSQ